MEEGARTLVLEPAKANLQEPFVQGAAPEANHLGVVVAVKLCTPAAAAYDSAKGSVEGAVPIAAAYKTRPGRR